MVKIRLSRMGKKKIPFYRIVVADERVHRNGAVIEELGYYYPSVSANDKQVSEYKLDKDKYEAWIKKGAQPTLSMKKIAKRLGIG